MEGETNQAYEDEINSLQEEIRMLEEQCESQQQEVLLHSDKEMQKKMELYKARSMAEFSNDQTVADLNAQLLQMESEMNLITKLTGIGFTEYFKILELTDDGKPVRKHRIRGYCLSLPFQLEFKVMEVQFKRTHTTCVTDLSIIMESSEFADLSSFISRAEETKSLLLFFRSLSAFAEWCEHRRVTFRHFKDKYPEFVKLPEGSRAEYMTIRSSKMPGSEMKIVWKIHVNEEGVVTPIIDLLTKIPEQVLGIDKEDVIERAPRCFRNLLHLLGIEASINSLIKTLCMED